MKYLRKFETEAEKSAWLNSKEYVKPNVVLIGETDGIEYNVEIDYSSTPLHIQAINDLTVSFSNTYEYSKDNVVWDSGTSSTKISATAGERVFFRASGLTPSSSNGIGKFTISNGTCNVCGNVMSMIYGSDFLDKKEVTNQYQFTRLFESQAKIIDVSVLVLPATTLSDYCYYYMFNGCTSLVNAPALPATTLKQYCYASMFRDCTSLVNAPALPATTLTQYCYSNMFRGCTSLVNAPALPATTLHEYCYTQMFNGCTSLVNAPALPATTLSFTCYSYMFNGCTSLVNAPVLPAKGLVGNCYSNMFKGCSQLNYVKAMFTTGPGSGYTPNWLSGVAAEGTFVKNAAATWNVTGVSGIPEGWTVQTAEA